MSKEVEYSKENAFWFKEIDYYEKKFSEWESRAKKITDRYKDARKRGDAVAQFNVLWSNTQTLAPALYAKSPKPNIERRFQDDDEVGLEASIVLERATNYFIDDENFDYILNQTVLDKLLSGRGTAWVRYVPYFKEIPYEDTPEGQSDENAPEQLTDDAIGEELDCEDVKIDYVHYEDFGHCWARTWEEVRAVWRKVYMSRQQVADRFGEDASKSISFSEKTDDGTYKSKKACIYEIWDKEGEKVIWLCRDCEEPLDEKEDPLGLKGFFPCPKPLFSTIANDNLIPTPYYVQYQDQAKELDNLTGRIASITQAVKVAGVYDSSAQGLESLLTRGIENQLVPVDSWAMFAEKGGLKGAVDFLPMQEIVQTLISLYEARDRVKQDLYEITGISDIIRGASQSGDTATAQRIKGQFATLRLDSMQADVQRFCRDLVRIIAEIIAEHFSEETIVQISGVKLATEAQKQLLLASAQAGQPLSKEDASLLKSPSWEQVFGLIRNDMSRCFRISVETDSTIKGDQEAEKAQRIEFLSAVSQFMDRAINLPPELQPLAGEMLLFGVRGFKTGRQLEQEIKMAIEKSREAAEQPKDQENPAIRLEQQRIQADIDLKQADVNMKQIELQMKQAEIRMKELELEAKRIETVNTSEEQAIQMVANV